SRRAPCSSNSKPVEPAASGRVGWRNRLPENNKELIMSGRTSKTSSQPDARGAERRTPDGIPIHTVYTHDDLPADLAAALGAPGSFPFTRGVYPDMYRGRLWTMRQYAGFGTAEETNRRYRYLLDHG